MFHFSHVSRNFPDSATEPTTRDEWQAPCLSSFPMPLAHSSCKDIAPQQPPYWSVGNHVERAVAFSRTLTVFPAPPLVSLFVYSQLRLESRRLQLHLSWSLSGTGPVTKTGVHSPVPAALRRLVISGVFAFPSPWFVGPVAF